MKYLRYLYNPLILTSIILWCICAYFLLTMEDKGVVFVGFIMVAFLAFFPLIINAAINFFIKNSKTAFILKMVVAVIIWIGLLRSNANTQERQQKWEEEHSQR